MKKAPPEQRYQYEQLAGRPDIWKHDTDAAFERYVLANYDFVEWEAPGGKVVGLRRISDRVPLVYGSGRSRKELKVTIRMFADRVLVATYSRKPLGKL